MIMAMTWKALLDPEHKQPYYKKLMAFLAEEATAGYTLYPPRDQILNAFKLTPFEETKVVILGQDPYIGPGQAHGLAFSVQNTSRLPPSLQNIFKELQADVGVTRAPNGDLTGWAKQGVLLLNTVLTVRAGEAHSHANRGWEIYTDQAIRLLSEHAKERVIFLLWGNPAQRKESLIDTKRHVVLKAAHPSPLSAYRGFFGCKHFSKVNELLGERGPIDWGA
ncbi:MAG: uracil-DNA glycosylase [Gammaproteobacteria bacterium]